MLQRFETRQKAGEELAKKLSEYRGQDVTVLGIPRGGVAVAAPVAEALGATLDIIVPRKVPIPWEPEAGFGAVCADGTLILNEEIMPYVRLTDEQIQHEAEKVRREIERRTRVYRGDRSEPDFHEKTVIVADDGLATGFTMIAALVSVRKAGAREIVCAVPVSPRDALEHVKSYADRTICLEVADFHPFAVAMFYQQFPEMTDDEVKALLEEKGREQQAA